MHPATVLNCLLLIFSPCVQNFHSKLNEKFLLCDELTVFSMVTPALAQSNNSAQSIPTLIKSHRPRLLSQYNGYIKRVNCRRESQLITIKGGHHERVSSNNYIKIPRVLCANLRSITKAKNGELLQQSAAYDLIIITESWLKPHKKNAFNIPGFKLLTVDRTTKRAGGVCMYIRDTLSTTVVESYT